MRHIFALCAGGVWLIAAGAFAQNNPELGDVGAQGQVQVQTQPVPPGGTWQPGPTPGGATTPPPPAAIAGPGGNRFEGTDHGTVVGHFGAGFFGIMEIPVAGIAGNNAADLDETLLAPTLGLRWWIQDWIGIEGGVGIGIQSGGTTVESDGDEDEANDPTLFGLAIHGGLPLVLTATKHFAFELIPELNFGFAVGGRDDESMANADIDLGGYVFELGGRAGAEIQFGFIDIPQLALQASIGLHLRIEHRSHSIGDTDTSNTQARFGTEVFGEPWDIFTGALTAIYYF